MVQNLTCSNSRFLHYSTRIAHSLVVTEDTEKVQEDLDDVNVDRQSSEHVLFFRQLVLPASNQHLREVGGKCEGSGREVRGKRAGSLYLNKVQQLPGYRRRGRGRISVLHSIRTQPAQ